MTNPAPAPAKRFAPRIELPRTVFLCISEKDLALRNPIANALIDRIPASGGWAFQAPLFNGVAGMFYYCNPAFDMGKANAEVPYPPKEAVLFYPKFERLLRDHFGDEIIATMAWDYVRENSEYFDWLFFTDAFNRIDDIRFLADKIGRDKCTVANIITMNTPRQLITGTKGMSTVNFALNDFDGPLFDESMDRLAELIIEPNTPTSIRAVPEPPHV